MQSVFLLLSLLFLKTIVFVMTKKIIYDDVIIHFTI